MQKAKKVRKTKKCCSFVNNTLIQSYLQAICRNLCYNCHEIQTSFNNILVLIKGINIATHADNWCDCSPLWTNISCKSHGTKPHSHADYSRQRNAYEVAKKA